MRFNSIMSQTKHCLPVVVCNCAPVELRGLRSRRKHPSITLLHHCMPCMQMYNSWITETALWHLWSLQSCFIITSFNGFVLTRCLGRLFDLIVMLQFSSEAAITQGWQETKLEEQGTSELPDVNSRLGIRPVGRQWWWCKMWRGSCQIWSETSTSHSINCKHTHTGNMTCPIARVD